MSNEVKMSREDIAKLEIGKTDISIGLARIITYAFLLVIVAVPICQHLVDFRAYTIRKKTGQDVLRKADWLPRSYDVFGIPNAVMAAFENKDIGPVDRVLSANALLLAHINRYEERLDSDSVLSKSLLGPLQLVMLQYFGQGNEKVYPGRADWLFFRPSVDYVAGPGFLERNQLRKRSLSGNEYTEPPQPDPRKAIIEFRNQLSARGIQLIIVPVPSKPTIHPEHYVKIHTARHKILHNESYVQFITEMKDAGVMVFDPTSALEFGYNFSGMAQYLKTDTHWTPGAMEIVARELALYLEEKDLSSSLGDIYERRSVLVSNLGDLAMMLQLPEGQSLYDEQEVSIRQVFDKRSGSLWLPSRGSEILVLGDSFSNIYSIREMDWGESAGFVEQIAYYLQRPVDEIVQNDHGAYATREDLSVQLQRDPDRLTGKKVVIWEFACRELAVGDWKIIDM